MARVLVVSDLWPPFPGGAERMMFNVARALAQRGAEVMALTGYGRAQRGDGVPVEPHAIGVRENHAQGAAVLADVIRRFRPDVLLAHHFYAFEFEAELVGSGVPLVQVVHNGHRIEGAALAVANSTYAASQVVMAPGDMVLTPPAYAEDVVAGSHGKAIGFVKPIAHKGVETVYRIAEAMPDREFVVLRGEWQNIEVIRPAANITFLEPVDEIREFYAHCRVVLVPSLSEDAGTVAQEATLNGLAVVASAVGGLVETAAGSILLPPEDVAAWVEAIGWLDDPALYQATVAAQLAGLERLNHAAVLDELAVRIDRLAS